MFCKSGPKSLDCYYYIARNSTCQTVFNMTAPVSIRVYIKEHCFYKVKTLIYLVVIIKDFCQTGSQNHRKCCQITRNQMMKMFLNLAHSINNMTRHVIQVDDAGFLKSNIN